MKKYKMIEENVEFDFVTKIFHIDHGKNPQKQYVGKVVSNKKVPKTN